MMTLVARVWRSLSIRCERLRIDVTSILWTHWLRSKGAKVGPGLQVRSGARFELEGGGAKIQLGSRVLLDRGVSVFVGREGALTLGDGVFVGRRTTIVANQEVHIGVGTQIAHDVTIIDTDHRHGDPRHALVSQGSITKPVSIGDECWISTGAILLKGSEVGARAVVGAGAVLTGPVPAAAVAVGVPARIL